MNRTTALLILVSVILIAVVLATFFLSQDKKNQESFNIYYSFGIGEKSVLDTGNNFFVKDMVCNSSKQYDFILNDDEMNEIYDAIIENDLLNIKDNFTENCDSSGNCLEVTPLSTSTLIINLNGQKKTIKYSANYFDENDLELKKLMGVQKIIQDIIDKKEKELNIEQPICGYL